MGDVDNYCVVRLISYTGHGTVDLIFHTMATAEVQYRRAVAVRNDWLRDNKGRDELPFISFEVKDDNGMEGSFNLFAHQILLIDMKKSAFYNAKSINAVEAFNDAAKEKYGHKKTGFST